MQLQPIDDAPFGVRALGVDCASIDKASIRAVRGALHQEQLVVVRGQQHLTPQEEVRFYRALYPEGTSVWRDQRENPWERYKVEQGNKAGTYQIPSEPGVLVLGKGEIDHYGLKVTLGGDRAAYGKTSGSQVLGGGTMQWHIDGTFYEHAPGRYTQMRCIEAPAGEGHWLDYLGDGNPLWCPAGATAFASGRTAYDAMADEVRERCLDTRAHYLPRPFETTFSFANTKNGLRVIDPESEARYESGNEAPGSAFADAAGQVYPLVWTCPDTRRQALMPQPRCLAFLEIQRSARQEFLGITASRRLVETWMLPAVSSDQVYVHAWQAGDLVIWHNRSVWHSATGKLAPEDRRVMHLTAFNASEAPVCVRDPGPVTL
ncbi:MAG: TauD/TfdA family dioxygenase [Arenicellales bacterium]|jgi:alpha-ketoglutarate-dependent taurine dioxygenase|nr:TauD/TfdA family dioxygenase [Arenicellales bacterium]